MSWCIYEILNLLIIKNKPRNTENYRSFCKNAQFNMYIQTIYCNLNWFGYVKYISMAKDFSLRFLWRSCKQGRYWKTSSLTTHEILNLFYVNQNFNENKQKWISKCRFRLICFLLRPQYGLTDELSPGAVVSNESSLWGSIGDY